MGLKWGFAGTGWIANVLAQDFKLTDMEILAVAARNYEGAKDFAHKLDIPKTFATIDELVADSELDIIYVAAINSAHKDIAIKALNSGKHVLCEKPVAMNAKETREIIAAAQANNRFFMEAIWTRFLPVQFKIREAIKEEKFGKVFKVIADYGEAPDRKTKTRIWDRENGGGALLDLGIYPISLTSSYLGIPVKTEISAFGKLTDTGVDETDTIIFNYQNGNQAMINTTISAYSSIRLSILGSRGRLELDYPLYGETTFNIFDNDNRIIEKYEGLKTSDLKGTGRQLQALEVERCINNGLLESPIITWDESIRIMEVLDEVRRQIGVIYPQD